MTPNEKTLQLRLLILKSRLKELIVCWREDARTRPRRGLYYMGLAKELSDLVYKFECEELGLRAPDIKD